MVIVDIQEVVGIPNCWFSHAAAHNFLLISGVPTLAYGVGCWMVIGHTEKVMTSKGPVNVYFAYKEDKGAIN